MKLKRCYWVFITWGKTNNKTNVRRSWDSTINTHKFNQCIYSLIIIIFLVEKTSSISVFFFFCLIKLPITPLVSLSCTDCTVIGRLLCFNEIFAALSSVFIRSVDVNLHLLIWTDRSCQQVLSWESGQTRVTHVFPLQMNYKALPFERNLDYIPPTQGERR